LSGDNFLGVAATGYGRRLFPGADLVVEEISALACGIHNLTDKKTRTVLNIGGQDMKLVKIGETGRIIDFKMNDKCASGTGRFFEAMSRTLNVPLAEFGRLASASRSPVMMSSSCAVFAESEIASLLYKSVAPADIIAGLHRSAASRIWDFIGEAYWLEGDFYFDGGPALNHGLARALEEKLGKEIKIAVNPQFTSAIGAAVNLFNPQRGGGPGQAGGLH